MAFLVLQGWGHEEGQDLVEEGAGTKLPRLVCDLSQGSLGGDKIHIIKGYFNTIKVHMDAIVEKYNVQSDIEGDFPGIVLE